jgi:hypothetical protein
MLDDDECGVVDGLIGSGNRSTLRNLAIEKICLSALFCAQIPYDLNLA